MLIQTLQLSECCKACILVVGTRYQRIFQVKRLSLLISAEAEIIRNTKVYQLILSRHLLSMNGWFFQQLTRLQWKVPYPLVKSFQNGWKTRLSNAIS